MAASFFAPPPVIDAANVDPGHLWDMFRVDSMPGGFAPNNDRWLTSMGLKSDESQEWGASEPGQLVLVGLGVTNGC
jgi:hypothetical protein